MKPDTEINLTCPILRTKPETSFKCKGAACAWWLDPGKVCAVQALGQVALDTAIGLLEAMEVVMGEQRGEQAGVGIMAQPVHVPAQGERVEPDYVAPAPKEGDEGSDTQEAAAEAGEEE